ncbi:MAG: hypothetical protein ABFD60_01545 [Bryobacteraceae bacterium]
MADLTIPSTGNAFVDIALQVGLPEVLDLIKWFKSRGTPEAAQTAEQLAAQVATQHKSDGEVQAKVAAALRGE